MEESGRNELLKGFDGNPPTSPATSDVNRQEWAAKIDAGDINPLFGLGPGRLAR
jgi:hypothetical protein